MTTIIKKLIFLDFLKQYPDGKGIFELVNGEIVQVELYKWSQQERLKM